MINKVNKAPVLKLVTSQPKQSENDPGSSQGSGMFYEGPPPDKKKEENAEKPTSPYEKNAKMRPADELPEGETPEPKLKAIEGGLKPKLQSLHSVFEEFFKRKKPGAAPGLTTQYSSDIAPAKGMLLNKKAE